MFVFFCVNNSVNSHVGNDDVTTGKNNNIILVSTEKVPCERAIIQNNYFL
jgi:hypothetical protein